jgi:hypothetical protein
MGEKWPDWANFCLMSTLGRLLKNDKSCPDYWATFFNRKVYWFILINFSLGYRLICFLINSSGHPDCYLCTVSLGKIWIGVSLKNITLKNLVAIQINVTIPNFKNFDETPFWQNNAGNAKDIVR